MSDSVRLLVCLSMLSASCGRIGYESLLSPSDGGDGSASDATADADMLDGATDALDGTMGADGSADASDASLPPPRVFADICRFTSGVLVKNGAAEDEALGPPLGAALAQHCQNGATYVEKSQGDVSVLEPSTNRPVIGPSQLGVLLGGEYYGLAVRYLDMADSPVAVSQSGNIYTARNRATGQVIRSWDLTQLNSSFDFAIVQVIREPISGSFLVHECGHYISGTRAGAYYLGNVLGPGLRNDTNTFYIIEWTDRNGDQLPNAGDTFALVGSG